MMLTASCFFKVYGNWLFSLLSTNHEKSDRPINHALKKRWHLFKISNRHKSILPFLQINLVTCLWSVSEIRVRFKIINIACNQTLNRYLTSPLQCCWKWCCVPGSYPNTLGKNIAGFLSGCILAFIFYFIFIFIMGYEWKRAVTTTSILGFIFCFGLAFSSRVRCIVTLMLPQFFTGLWLLISLQLTVLWNWVYR